MNMVTRTSLLGVPAAVLILVLFFAGPAACQDARGAPARDESTRFDYSNSHSFPHIFYPYTVPFLPAPRLDNSQRLQDLIVDGKLTLTLDDAIALALRADCPIYVSEQVMQSAKLNTSGPPEGPTAEQLRGWLEGLNDEDLGRYKM